MSSRGGASTARASKAARNPTNTESIHERSARLQREGHLPREVGPGEEVKPITRIENYRADPFHAPDPAFLTRLYGEHQLGSALSQYTHEMLREVARNVGVKPGRTTAETISRITSAATGGRYSANFGASSAKAAPSTRSTNPDRRAASYERQIAQHEAQAAKHASEAARLRAEYEEYRRTGNAPAAGAAKTSGTKQGAARNTTAKREPPEGAIARIDSQIGTDRGANTDPRTVWNALSAGSRTTYNNVLRQEPLGSLEAIARNVRVDLGGEMPKRSGRGTRADILYRHALAKFIADQSAHAFGGGE